MIVYDLSLLPAQSRDVIINLEYLESHVQIEDRCEPWKFTSGAKKLLHALQ
jgi:hypothetical protein